jgi:hypothetical protein
MTSRSQKFRRLALSLTVAATATALGGAAHAQAVNQMGTGKVIVRCDASAGNCLDPAGGSLRNAPESDAADPPAEDQAAAEPEPADEPPADVDEGTVPASREDDPAEPE